MGADVAVDVARMVVGTGIGMDGIGTSVGKGGGVGKRYCCGDSYRSGGRWWSGFAQSRNAQYGQALQRRLENLVDAVSLHNDPQWRPR